MFWWSSFGCEKWSKSLGKSGCIVIIYIVFPITVEPRLSGPRVSGLFDYPYFFSGPIFSWIFIGCDCCKQPNNPFKRLLKQRIILYAFQNSQVRRDKELFSWYMIGSIIVLLPREFHAWLVPSVWVIERSIVNSNQKLVYEAKASCSID